MLQLNTITQAIRKQAGKSGTQFWVDSNGDGKKQADEAVLVKRNEDKWEPVRDLPGSVDRNELTENYGVWLDMETTRKEGTWPFRKEVVDRPLNGKIDEGEVAGFEISRVENEVYLGAEVTQESSSGVLYLESKTLSQLNTNYITETEAQQHWQGVRAEDSLWKIAGLPSPQRQA